MRYVCLVLLFLAACAKKQPEPVAAAAVEPPPPAVVHEEPKKVVEDQPIPAPPDVAAPPLDAERTASGLASRVLQAGSGPRPTESDVVRVHYSGWTTDGVLIDSSLLSSEPTTLPLSGVIPGWTEGVQLMAVGEKRRLWVPGALAYGDRPTRPGRPYGMLVFDIELLGIVKAPSVPADVAKAPKNAKRTKSGLAYRVLTPGKGTTHPTATDIVRVHYSGWKPNGEMFDSTFVRGPAVFALDGVIRGWTEAVQLMTEGEVTRFWIPGKLAYGDKDDGSGAPSGPLVFDIELLAIKPAN